MADEQRMSHVEKLCADLQTAADGLAVLGVRCALIEAAIAKLRKQAEEIERLHADPIYVAGYNQGHADAFATGLTGGPETEDP